MWKLILAWVSLAPMFAQTATAPATPSFEQKEEFLMKANVVEAKTAAKGVTSTLRATLSDGTITHDASIQRVNEEKSRFEGGDGSVELNFRDTYKFNIAAYRLGRLIGVGDMIPPSVERKYKGDTGAWTWWIEDVQMDEATRQQKKLAAPDKESWNRQYVIMQVFDNLIYNTDRNQTNILYDKNWKLWMIDHTRAFRIRTDLLNEKALKNCDRLLLTKMKALTYEDLKPELSPYLRDSEIKAILKRRDKLVTLFEKKGDGVLFDYLK
jgi:hypothetical protein